MSVKYIVTEFVPLDYNGNIDLTRTTSNWTVPQTLYLPSQPVLITHARQKFDFVPYRQLI
jgi:hypothetical protein